MNLTQYIGYNCQRNGIVCDGYPVAVPYGLQRSHRMTSNEPGGVQQDTSTQPQGIIFNLEEDAAHLFDGDLGFLFESDNGLLHPEMGNNEMSHTARLGGFDVPYGEVLGPGIPSNSQVLQTEASMNSAAPIQPMVQLAVSSQHVPRNSSLNDLPFLLDNINTSTERRLFSHFTTMTSRVLTLSSGKYNPLTSIVVPLATKDPMVMHSLLCLAGSHLVSISEGGSAQPIDLEKYRLHNMAVRAHSLRVQALEQRTGQQSSQELESVLASALLLCLYEICEGSGDATWSIHLDTARKLISWTESNKTDEARENASNSGIPTNVRPEINRFLLEFFIYHDTLAAVTVTSSSPVSRPRNLYQEGDSVEDLHMVGVNDGLGDLISSIADLRSQAVATSPGENGDIICEAVAIWDELANWKPKSEDREQRLIGSLYQWALFIWLYCIVHPDGIADMKLQTAVKSAIQDLEKISSASGVFSCLLFPLFIIGTASIEENDRGVVKSRFRGLTAWSGLGNVKVAQQIVQNSWANHDKAIPRSWDWIAQMEKHGISVPVT
jgi:Fungal specific transcription factor domain